MICKTCKKKFTLQKIKNQRSIHWEKALEIYPMVRLIATNDWQCIPCWKKTLPTNIVFTPFRLDGIQMVERSD